MYVFYLRRTDVSLKRNNNTARRLAIGLDKRRITQTASISLFAERADVAVTLYICVRKAPSSNLGCDNGYAEVFSDFT
jgi:hypothetical protein